ncbi:MAG: PBECR4 domain-containing protein [Lachnospiraceae bacterium]|nr:PBECR4 domain-containing protein [Lachnospiraceae bacterium]
MENKSLLFVCLDKHKNISCIEFSFYNYNFLHLTGLKTTKRFVAESNEQSDINTASDKIPAVRFYEKCLDHKLMTTDFEFSDSGTTPMKLDVLPLVICKNLSANMIGDFNSPHPKLYTEKVAGGTKAYIGFIKDNITHMYVPNTVVKEDLRKNVTNYVRIIATYRKNIDETEYSEIVYTAKKVEWDKVKFPEYYEYLPKP